MIEKLLEIADRAGSQLDEFFHSKDLSVSYKGEIDLVTQYDVAMEKMITKELKEAFPDFKVVGEENYPPDTLMQSGKVIYLDPIDGTTSFVHRFQFSAISIGVSVDRQIECGVVCSPMLRETYYAVKGKGAFLNGEPIRVSSVDKPIRALFSTGFAYDRNVRRKSLPTFYNLLDISQGMRRTGAASLDLCYVAKGAFDMYYESMLKPWDISAGILIVQEAGGEVTDIDGNPHDLSTRTVIASNGKVHEAYLREMRATI